MPLGIQISEDLIYVDHMHPGQESPATPTLSQEVENV